MENKVSGVVERVVTRISYMVVHPEAEAFLDGEFRVPARSYGWLQGLFSSGTEDLRKKFDSYHRPTRL